MTPEDRAALVAAIQKSVMMRVEVKEQLEAGADFREFFKEWREVEEFDLNISRRVRILRPH